jgi:hypothetical protein
MWWHWGKKKKRRRRIVGDMKESNLDISCTTMVLDLRPESSEKYQLI